MIFQFPNLETFRLAVTSSQVPPEVSAAPAEVAFDSEGRPSVRSAAGIPPKTMQNALRKLGVKSAPQHYGEAVLTVDCWPQILPVVKQAGMPDVTSNSPVLFEMPLSEMPAVVSEMLRLGNDRQSFRTLANPAGGGERVLLKVIGPPYYTLLRAIDKSTQKDAAVTAYLEAAPRVWVEIGHAHSLAGQIKPADGQLLLLRPDREWSIVQDGLFQDVYEILDFKLPAASVEWQESHLKGKLVVPLRIVSGNAADVSEMWVLTENAVDQLDALVRDADERLMARLLFAVVEDENRKTIVLKTRPSKLSPPVLSLEHAHGFKPFWKLPNLFVPVGSRLMPTLRRDAVRKLLAEDPAQVVWIMPSGEGKFTPQSLRDESFRPLEDWIDYIIDHEHAALTAWMQATRFRFDSFTCPDESPDRPKGPPEKKKKRLPREISGAELETGPPSSKSAKRTGPASEETDFLVPAEVLPPSEIKVRLRELEKEFLEHDGPLDSDVRQAIWPEMARLNAMDGRELEAAICWSNAFWELPEVPSEGAWAWLQGEDRRAQKVPTAAEFDAAISNKLPSPSDVRALMARVIHGCRLPTVPGALIERLPRIREFLEQNEGVLGARCVWLTWWHITRVSGTTDVLTLARVRDRLLQRLLTEGLNKERDLPYFLRTAGEQNSDRLRQVRDRAMKVHKLVEKWHERDSSTKKSNLESFAPALVNKPYVDLIFAFAMAKLGEVTTARDLMGAASSNLATQNKDEPIKASIHQYLLEAFVWRIENAIQGKPHSGTLSARLVEKINEVDGAVEKLRKKNGPTARYVIDRMIRESWILEPQRGPDPYAKNTGSDTSLIGQLGVLAHEQNSAKVIGSLNQLLKSRLSDEDRLRVVKSGMEMAARLGEPFAIHLLSLVDPVIRSPKIASARPEEISGLLDLQRKLLASAIFIAAHFDLEAQVQKLFSLFMSYLEAQPVDQRYQAVSEVSRDLIKTLRRFGFRDEINIFLNKVSELVLHERHGNSNKPFAPTNWMELLTCGLAVAEAWLVFGVAEKANTFLDETRLALFEPKRFGIDFEKNFINVTKLVRAYIGVLAFEPLESALSHIEELFEKLGRLPNTTTTSEYYSRLHLNIVEDLVRALINDALLMGDQARLWLDDDEYLVRRRIHADMRSVLAQGGL